MRATLGRGRPKAVLAVLLATTLAGCGGGAPPPEGEGGLYPNETPELRALITGYADANGVPRDLVERVVARESSHRPGARNGPHYGLMQIRPDTARTMGYRGAPEGLFDPETNLRWGVKYLRGAWIVADGDRDAAIGWYGRGYYDEAKRRGLLEETGLR